jgi:hypothetical protein
LAAIIIVVVASLISDIVGGGADDAAKSNMSTWDRILGFCVALKEFNGFIEPFAVPVGAKGLLLSNLDPPTFQELSNGL